LGGNSTAEKLDSLMVVTFEHLKSCEASGRLIEVLFDAQFFNAVDLLFSVANVQFPILLKCGD
jgi:hypothetical protein